MHTNQLPGIDIKCAGATAAGATVVNHDVTNLGGMNSLLACVKFGAVAITTNTPPQVLIQQADVSDYSDAETVTALTQTIVAGMANKQLLLELARPTKKYLRVSVVRTGASNAIAIVDVVTIADYGRKLPLEDQADDYERLTASAPAS